MRKKLKQFLSILLMIADAYLIRKREKTRTKMYCEKEDDGKRRRCRKSGSASTSPPIILSLFFPLFFSDTGCTGRVGCVLQGKILVKCQFFNKKRGRGKNVSGRKNSAFPRKHVKFYVNGSCIISGISNVDNHCGKACGKCGKVEVFHKETGTFPKPAAE